jgi:hypothetical protein
MFKKPAPSIPGYPQGASGKMRHAAPGHSFDLRRRGLSPSSPRLQPTLPSQFRSVRSSLRTHRKDAQSGTKTSLRPNPTEPERIGPNQTYIFFWSSKSCLLPALTCQPLFAEPRPCGACQAKNRPSFRPPETHTASRINQPPLKKREKSGVEGKKEKESEQAARLAQFPTSGRQSRFVTKHEKIGAA